MKKFLTARVFGGLGNQLFIYAASKSLAILNNCDLYLDVKSGYKNDKFNRKFKLANFNIDCKLTGKLFWSARLSKYKQKIFEILNIKKNVLNSDASFLSYLTPIYLDSFKSLPIKKNKYIEGYWQSYKYFDHIDQLLRKQLCVPNSLKLETKKIEIELLNTNSVGIHLRFYEKKIHSNFNLSFIYYLNAINYINKKVDYPKFYIFSDDVALAKELLKNCDIEYEIISEQNFLLDEVDELYLFSKCKHAIISNSTFSWWGAWLTDIEKKIIISPEINITGPYMAWGFYGLIPEHWIKLSVISLI